jgi:hypothetical protein
MSSADVIDKAEFQASRSGEKYDAPPVLSSALWLGVVAQLGQ